MYRVLTCGLCHADCRTVGGVFHADVCGHHEDWRVVPWSVEYQGAQHADSKTNVSFAR